MSSFTVAIVGRPNVGKSTLFNRLLEQRKAIVDDISGVTRDRQYGIADWNGKTFNVIDTGGFVVGSDDVFEVEIRKQVEIALEEANLLLFVTDTTTGITDQDAAFTEVLRRGKKPVLLVVNKVDNSERMLDATEFYALGFDKLFMVSSISGSGTGELLDEITTYITDEYDPAIPIHNRKKVVAETEELDIDIEDPDFDAEAYAEKIDERLFEEEAEVKPETELEVLPKIAIIGQPNAGKSTLLARLFLTLQAPRATLSTPATICLERTLC